MAFRTTIKNQGDLHTERIAGSDSEFVIETTNFRNTQTGVVNNFSELRNISIKSQTIHVAGTGSFERQTYVSQTDDNLNTIVTTGNEYAYVRQMGSITQKNPNNTTTVVTQITQRSIEADIKTNNLGNDNNLIISGALGMMSNVNGGIVTVSTPGTYYFANTIVMPPNVKLQGVPGVIFAFELAPLEGIRTFCSIPNSSSNVKISCLEIIGDSRLPSTSIHSFGLFINGAENWEIDNVTIRNFMSEGIVLARDYTSNTLPRNGKFLHCKSIYNGSGNSVNGNGAIAIVSGFNCIFEDCDFSYSGFGQPYGVYGSFGLDIEPDAVEQRVYDLTFYKCRFEYNNGVAVASVHRNDNSSQVDRVTFDKCVFRGNQPENGANLQSVTLRGRGYVVRDCEFYETYGAAIILQGGEHCLIERNRIYGSSSGTSIGIYLYICQSCIVRNNIVVGMSLPGILQDSADSGNQIIDNVVSGCGYSGGVWSSNINLYNPVGSQISRNKVRKLQKVTCVCNILSGTTLRPFSHWVATNDSSLQFTPIKTFTAITSSISQSIDFFCISQDKNLINPNTLTILNEVPTGFTSINNVNSSSYYPDNGLKIITGSNNIINENDLRNAGVNFDLVNTSVNTFTLVPNLFTSGSG